jgi:hypothetical protein
MQSMAFLVDVFIHLCNFICRNLILKQLNIIVSRKISHSARIAAPDMQHQFALFVGPACVAFRLFTFLAGARLPN